MGDGHLVGPGSAQGEGQAPHSAELAALPAAVERLLAVEPEERALRRLVSALADAGPDADSAALLLTRGPRLEIVAAIGLEEATPEARGVRHDTRRTGAR